MKHLIIYIVAFFLPIAALCQTINNTVGYRSINKQHYFRILYENDYFTNSDEFYTQGINAEYVAPSFSKLPTGFVLLKPKNSTTQYGIAIQHNAYTPASIEDTRIRYGDRPYAAALMLQPFAIATNEIRKKRISTTLSLGVTGRIAGGEWMQNTIHAATNNVMPQGWKYQVANDAVINYRVQYEKAIVDLNNILQFSAIGTAHAGTLLTKASVGGSLMLGYFESPYSSKHSRKFSIYVYTHPQLNIVGYDATLQGGVFNKSTPYTVAAADINRIVLDNRYGLVINWGRMYLEYFRFNTGREFATGELHAWGGLQIGIGF